MNPYEIVEEERYPRLHTFLKTSFNMLISDVRGLLRLPYAQLKTGCNLALASQCPISDWHPNLGDPTLADAVCDRLLHNAYRIELRGDSMHIRPGITSENDRKEAVANDAKLS